MSDLTTRKRFATTVDKKLLKKLEAGELDDRIVEIEVEDNNSQMVEIFSANSASPT